MPDENPRPVEVTDETELEPARLRLGISSCLLGEEVRYDGGHKRDEYLIKTLGEWVDWVAVCPEMEMGLGVPRQTLRLVGDWREPRMVVGDSGEDLSAAMRGWAPERIEKLSELDLDGYVLKSGSPSCGLFQVKVYDHDRVPTSKGRGLFAAELARRLPMLPLEEGVRLSDYRLRDNFIGRVFAYRRWRALAQNPSPGGLVAFHRDHKLTLMAHSPTGQAELDSLISTVGSKLEEGQLEQYGVRFMEAMSKVATVQRHTNVLHQLLGVFKDLIDPAGRVELAEMIEEFRLRRMPLIVPLTLFRHHIRRRKVPRWVRTQTYLVPSGGEMIVSG